MNSKYEWLLAAIRDGKITSPSIHHIIFHSSIYIHSFYITLEPQRSRPAHVKYIIPSFLEYLHSSNHNLQAELQAPSLIPPSTKETFFLGTTHNKYNLSFGGDNEEKYTPLLLACGDNLLARFKQHHVRISFDDINVFNVSCEKCSSNVMEFSLYGCRCALQVLHQILVVCIPLHAPPSLSPPPISPC